MFRHVSCGALGSYALESVRFHFNQTLYYKFLYVVVYSNIFFFTFCRKLFVNEFSCHVYNIKPPHLFGLCP